MTKSNRKPLYEGKAKVLFEGPEPGTLIQYFKDDATAFNGVKHDIVNGKGVLNNRISEAVMTKLNDIGIPTHFIKTLNTREQLIRKVEIIPLEVVIRNFAAGSLVSRLGIEQGSQLDYPLLEYYYKEDALNDPLISREHAEVFGWADPDELDEIESLALRINDFLSGLFLGIGIRLVDFKLEFGRRFEDDEVEIILADEISPDSCRLWDLETGRILDKDIFRKDLGDLNEAYTEVASRLGILNQEEEGNNS